MPHDSSASAAPKDYCRLFEDISPSEDGSPGRAVRVLLPVFLAVAFFRAAWVARPPGGLAYLGDGVEATSLTAGSTGTG
jgi:hypothetical protein